MNLLTIVPGAFALAFVIKAAIRALKKKSTLPNLPSQGESVYYQVRWRWGFDRHNTLEYLAGFCPECDSQIYPRRAPTGPKNTPGTIFRCEKCDREVCALDALPAQVTDTVERMIARQLIGFQMSQSRHAGKI